MWRRLTSYRGSSSLACTLRPACLVGSVATLSIVPVDSEVLELGPWGSGQCLGLETNVSIDGVEAYSNGLVTDFIVLRIFRCHFDETLESENRWMDLSLRGGCFGTMKELSGTNVRPIYATSQTSPSSYSAQWSLTPQ